MQVGETTQDGKTISKITESEVKRRGIQSKYHRYFCKARSYGYRETS